jgi:hypothetical protein
MMMKGNGVIIVRLENSYNYYEHMSLLNAKAEAHRLAESIGGKFVVYVPVVLVERTPKTQETPVKDWHGEDDDLPF